MIEDLSTENGAGQADSASASQATAEQRQDAGAPPPVAATAAPPATTGKKKPGPGRGNYPRKTKATQAAPAAATAGKVVDAGVVTLARAKPGSAVAKMAAPTPASTNAAPVARGPDRLLSPIEIPLSQRNRDRLIRAEAKKRTLQSALSAAQRNYTDLLADVEVQIDNIHRSIVRESGYDPASISSSHVHMTATDARVSLIPR